MGTFFLLPVDVFVQGVIKHSLALAARLSAIWRSAASTSGAACEENFSRT
jgi:hypothetical protein